MTPDQWAATAKLLGYTRIEQGPGPGFEPFSVDIYAPDGELILSGGEKISLRHIKVANDMQKRYGVKFTVQELGEWIRY